MESEDVHGCSQRRRFGGAPGGAFADGPWPHELGRGQCLGAGPRGRGWSPGQAGGGRGQGGQGGPGGHGGRGGHGARGGGRPIGAGTGAGRVFGPGELRLLLLRLIEETPRHGYELIKVLEDRFAGAYAPSPGAIYPNLMLLEELGHVQARSAEGSRRQYEITPQGRAYLEENADAVRGVLARLEIAAQAVGGAMPPREVQEAMHTLRRALMFHRGEWSAAEIERVRSLIEAAAADIVKAG